MLENDCHKKNAKPYKIEELFEYSSFKEEDKRLQGSYSHKNILITGAAGSL